MSADNHANTVLDHYTRLWGTKTRILPAPASPHRHELPEEFAVVEFAPHGEREMWTYATRAMSQPGDAQPLELHIFSPRKAPELAELLTAVAHYHHTGEPVGRWAHRQLRPTLARRLLMRPRPHLAPLS